MKRLSVLGHLLYNELGEADISPRHLEELSTYLGGEMMQMYEKYSMSPVNVKIFEF